MDLSLDYACYSESNTPRTPSPREDDMSFNLNYKHVDPVVPPLFVNHDDQQYWNANPQYNPRGSLLQELYEGHDIYADHHHQVAQQQQHYILSRRATFPYVRQDRDDSLPLQQYPPFVPQNEHYPQLYQESLPLPADPAYIPSLSSSPHSSYHDFDESNIKLEDSPQVIVPSQSPYYHPQSPPAAHPMSMSYLSPHTGLPVQHTDDAASKETQYLRRRCFNCHTTEPPSWRRSTLNPGKIVCNKCGLYERTHLRPRPLRFDELRAGNKARKQSNTQATSPPGGVSKGSVSPKAKMAAMVKKEPRDFGIARRSSVSSASSTSGASDWDDSVSVYSTGSAPPTSFNSPNVNSFPLSRDSQSPPRDGGIRLPNAPLSDIASLQLHSPEPPQLQSPPQQCLVQSPPLSSPPHSATLPAAPLSVQQAAMSPSPRKSQTLPPTLGSPFLQPADTARRASVSSVISTAAAAGTGELSLSVTLEEPAVST